MKSQVRILAEIASCDFFQDCNLRSHRDRNLRSQQDCNLRCPFVKWQVAISVRSQIPISGESVPCDFGRDRKLTFLSMVTHVPQVELHFLRIVTCDFAILSVFNTKQALSLSKTKQGPIHGSSPPSPPLDHLTFSFF